MASAYRSSALVNLRNKAIPMFARGMDLVPGRTRFRSINHRLFMFRTLLCMRERQGGRRKAEGRRRKAEGESRRRKAEGGRQKAEDGRQKAEDGRQKAEGRRRKAEGGRQKAGGFICHFLFSI